MTDPSETLATVSEKKILLNLGKQKEGGVREE